MKTPTRSDILSALVLIRLGQELGTADATVARAVHTAISTIISLLTATSP
jgi:hypothetical protein